MTKDGVSWVGIEEYASRFGATHRSEFQLGYRWDVQPKSVNNSSRELSRETHQETTVFEMVATIYFSMSAGPE